MKKLSSVVVLLLLISLVAVMTVYAQDDTVTVTNSETDADAPGAEAIVIIDPSADPEDQEQPVGADDSGAAEDGMHVQWNENANGTVDFPGGQQIMIGAERDEATMPAGYIVEFRLDDVGDGETSSTEITMISGCITIELSSDDTNDFVINFENEGQTSVEIQPPPEPAEPPPTVSSALVCVTPDGGVSVDRLSGDSNIQISSDGEPVVSNVVESSTVGADGQPGTTPSGVGAASG